MKTSLCDSCVYGLIREWIVEMLGGAKDFKTLEGFAPCTERHFTNKCMLANDYPGVITMCNRHKKVEGKVTYHDPDFKEYEEKVLEE